MPQCLSTQVLKRQPQSLTSATGCVPKSGRASQPSTRLDEIKKVLKSSPALRGELMVDAVTEPRNERDARVEREKHERNVYQLALIKQATPDSPAAAALERKIADYEGRIPVERIVETSRRHSSCEASE